MIPLKLGLSQLKIFFERCLGVDYIFFYEPITGFTRLRNRKSVQCHRDCNVSYYIICHLLCILTIEYYIIHIRQFTASIHHRQCIFNGDDDHIFIYTIVMRTEFIDLVLFYTSDR